ncbi:MAG: pyrroline-5-carboxylate reductase [Thiotrichales bacterium]|nr:MAG: pyrroline-5-carboxylate reductase [Thiotrichales bacterium]
MTTRIAFIGGGNMATSLAGGLIAGGIEPAAITIAEPDSDKRSALSRQFSVNTTADNLETLQHDVVVLSVKPQLMQTVCKQLADSATNTNPLYVSIAAGIRTVDISRWLQRDAAIVRCMPNTPALIQCGATALYANPHVDAAQKQLADDILRAAGITTWVTDEGLLDVVTALSGSGPAYFFLLMEAMQKTAVNLGLDSDTASTLTLQTALGAARMANESGVNAGELRARVTSKGGTTAAAIASFEHDDFHDSVRKALHAAYNRSRELADELGKDN